MEEPDAYAAAVPIRGVTTEDWPSLAAASPRAAAAAGLVDFDGRPGQFLLAPGADGRLGEVLFGSAPGENGTAAPFRSLSASVPPGDYRLGPALAERFADPAARERIALAWAQGCYRFDRYRRSQASPPAPRLIPPPGADMALAGGRAAACAGARDLINTPANDMGPAEVEAAARRIASTHDARIEVTIGEALPPAGYPAVHAVGRAAAAGREPRMIEIAWGAADHPLVALVGKGVVFDTGGLDIKPAAGMRLMKKDMGGAAHVLALASMIMDARLPVRLAVLTPVVENAISGAAMRPGDVLASRKGLTIEVGHTDAEGRLVLADALARAAELSPDLTLDLATLTGAARVALGPQVVPFYTADDRLAEDLAAAALKEEDPLWRMPLWAPYESAIDSDIADVCNDAAPWAQAGSLTAALFLRRFAPAGPWAHFDIYAWNPRARPGWPVGAEIQAILAIFAVLRERYG